MAKNGAAKQLMKHQNQNDLLGLMNKLILVIGILCVALLLSICVNLAPLDFFTFDKSTPPDSIKIIAFAKDTTPLWALPDTHLIPNDRYGATIQYGKELIAHTAKYLGPNGRVMSISNGMNCQNCHLNAGTKAWGNNYGAVYANYPKYRARSGSIENIFKRINDCIERSLNGKALDTTNKEILAIKSYIEWLGKGVKKGVKPNGSGIYDLAFPTHALDPQKGQIIYRSKCASCHMTNGGGQLNALQTEYTYPPLWGEHSYNIGAGLFRMSRLAGYVKYNMPLGASFSSPILSDEEAWEVAAYINSQPRPAKDLSKDWPKMEEKPFDHPFGPYADGYSEMQHKYGPFQPIKEKAELLHTQKKKS